MADVAVIGAGVGGLAGAIRLARAGHNVTIFERNDRVGGKLAGVDIDGFHFDTGPSLLTLPQTFRDLGVSLDARRLSSHPFRYRFSGGSSLDVFDDASETRASFESFAPGSGHEWQRMHDHGRDVWTIAERTFFAGPMYPLRKLVDRLQSPMDLVRIDAMRTVAQRANRLFRDRRLRQWFNRYATYSGSSPWKAPATLSCIPFLEQEWGCWHVNGGLASLAGSLGKAATDAGVAIELRTDVERILSENNKVTGVQVAGQRQRFDVVLANADAEHVYRDLTPNMQRLRQTHKAGRSSSGFALLLGLTGATDGLAHHNVWFGSNQKNEFAQIFSGRGVSDDPTIYICCSSVSDASQSPDGCENWFVLVNVGPGAQTDWHTYAELLIDRLGVRDRIVVREMITPHDLENRYRAPGGAIYGSSSNGRRSAFLRASNRGPLDGLYLAGGSAHPGGGLPLVAMSGRFAADLVQADK